MLKNKRNIFLLLLILIIIMGLMGGCTIKRSISANDKVDSIHKNVINTGTVKIQYLGHSAFVFTSATGITIATDFYEKNKFAYAEDVPKDFGLIGNDITRLLISHSHGDHSYIPNKVKIMKFIYGSEKGEINDVDENSELEKIDDVKIGRFKSEHFLQAWNYGMMKNTVFTIDIDGIKIVHLGDAHGTMADKTALEELKKKIGNIDILLMPIGTPVLTPMDYDTLKTTLQVMDAKVTIPMHYWSLADKEQFLSNTIKDGYNVEKLDNNSKVIKINDFKNQKSKTIWSLVVGQYTK